MTAAKTETVKTELGENVTCTIDGDTLTLTINLKHRGGLSTSGKTFRVASTGGFKPVDGTPVIVNLNVAEYAVKK